MEYGENSPEWMKLAQKTCVYVELGDMPDGKPRTYKSGVAGDMEIISDSLNGVIDYKGINPDTSTGMRIAKLAKLGFLESPAMMKNILAFYLDNKETFEAYTNFGPSYFRASMDVMSGDKFASKLADPTSDLNAKKATLYL